MKIFKNRRAIKSSTRIVAADEELDTNDYNIRETIDTLEDDVDDIQDTLEDVQEDDVDIEIDNNIANHYIAECDSCHGVFISALVESDQEVEHVSGICPLCDKETNQYLKWIIKDVLKLVKEMERSSQETKEEVKTLTEQIHRLQSAQRTGLQTQILEKSKRIQLAIDEGDIDYEEELKQLIILYREYYICGFNCQGKLYFNDTIAKASEDNNTLVRGLMNTYFSEYQP